MLMLDNLKFIDGNTTWIIMNRDSFEDFVNNGETVREDYKQVGYRFGFMNLSDDYTLLIITKNKLRRLIHVL